MTEDTNSWDTTIKTSESFSFNRNDLKHVAIMWIAATAVRYLANITLVASFIESNFGISADAMTMLTAIFTYIAKRFVENNQK